MTNDIVRGNKMRLIDADKLKYIVRGLPLDGTITILGATSVIHVIDSMPTIAKYGHCDAPY